MAITVSVLLALAGVGYFVDVVVLPYFGIGSYPQ